MTRHNNTILSLLILFIVLFVCTIVGVTTATQQSQSINEWSINDVQQWLASLSMAQYQSAFAQEAVDGATLLELNEHDLLESLHVAKLGHRKKLMKEIQHWKKPNEQQQQQQSMPVLDASALDEPQPSLELPETSFDQNAFADSDLSLDEINTLPFPDAELHTNKQKQQSKHKNNKNKKRKQKASSSSSHSNERERQRNGIAEDQQTAVDSHSPSAFVLQAARSSKRNSLSEQQQGQIRELMRDALVMHQSHQLERARALYERVLSMDAHHARALHMLGLVVMIADGDAATAIRLLKQSLQEQDDSDCHVNLGNFYWQQRQLEPATQQWQLALDGNFLAGGVPVRARYAESLYALSLRDYNEGSISECRQRMTHALRLAREAELLHYPILQEPQWFIEGMEELRQHRWELSHQIRATLLDSWLHLGLLSDSQDNNQALALECFNRALLIMPTPLDSSKPSNVQISAIRQEVYGHRAQLLQHYQGGKREASKAVKEADSLQLDRTAPHNKKMVEYLHKSCHFESAASLAHDIVDDVIFTSPNYAFLFESENEMLLQRKRYEAQLLDILDDRTVSALWSMPMGLEWCRARFYLAYQGLNNKALNELLARVYLHLAPSLSYTSPSLAYYEPSSSVLSLLGSSKTKIRIGFISAFLTAHPVGRTLQGYIEHLPRDLFHVHVFFITLQPGVENDALLLQMRQWADEFVSLPVEHTTENRRLIEAAQLHVLVYGDIGMEPTSYFLAFSRLAAVQALTFGHPDTSGLATIDYFLSHEGFDQHSELGQQFYTERLVSLPGVGYWSQSRPAQSPSSRAQLELDDAQLRLPEPSGVERPVPTTEQPHLWTMYLVTKSVQFYSPAFVDTVARILHAHPWSFVALLLDSGKQSRGFEMHNQCLESISDRIEARLQHYANHPHEPLSLNSNLTLLIPARQAVSGRVRFVDKGDHDYFMSLLQMADVLLQPMPLDGTTTTLEALSVRTPTVLSRSATLGGRMGSAIYQYIGVTENIADSHEQYVEIAVRLGKSRTANQALRKRVAEASKQAHLFQDPRAIQHFADWAHEAAKLAASKR